MSGFFFDAFALLFNTPGYVQAIISRTARWRRCCTAAALRARCIVNASDGGLPAGVVVRDADASVASESCVQHSWTSIPGTDGRVAFHIVKHCSKRVFELDSSASMPQHFRRAAGRHGCWRWCWRWYSPWYAPTTHRTRTTARTANAAAAAAAAPTPTRACQDSKPR